MDLSLVPILAFIINNIYIGKGSKQKFLQSLNVTFMTIKTDARHLFLKFSTEFYLIKLLFPPTRACNISQLIFQLSVRGKGTCQKSLIKNNKVPV